MAAIRIEIRIRGSNYGGKLSRDISVFLIEGAGRIKKMIQRNGGRNGERGGEGGRYLLGRITNTRGTALAAPNIIFPKNYSFAFARARARANVTKANACALRLIGKCFEKYEPFNYSEP